MRVFFNCHLFVFIFLTQFAFSQVNSEVIFNGTTEQLEISSKIQFYKDTTRLELPENIAHLIQKSGKLRSTENNAIVFNDYSANFWGQFSVYNKNNKISSLLFRCNNYYLDKIELYEITSDSIVKIGLSGDHLNLKDKSIKQRDHIFDINFLPNQKREFLFLFNRKAKSVVSFELLTSVKYMEESFKDSILLGMYIGGLFLFIFFAFGMYIFIRKKMYLYYGLYVLTCGLALCNVYGVSYFFVYPNIGEFSNYIVTITTILAIIFFVLFTFHFLKLKKSCPKWYLFFKFYVFGYFGIVLIILVLYNLKIQIPLLPIHYSLISITILLLLTSAILSYKSNRKSSVYFLISFSPILFGSIIQISQETGVLSSTFFSEYTLLFASFFEILIISIGIALQLKEENNKRILLSERVAKHGVELNQKLFEGQDNEKRRIALIIHDTFGVKLKLVKTLVESNNLNKAALQIDSLGSEIRDLSHVLMPTILDYISLPEAISDIAEKVTNEDIRIIVEKHSFPNEIDKKIKVTLYNIIQELINNVLKHADASSIIIQFTIIDDEFSITVEDNGSGFVLADIEGNGLGLPSIKSRIEFLNGHFTIESKLEEGTLCIIKLSI
ncbi:MAG: signal transduction histidine kinase [Bacteroidia bacterium]|jgi:signal transduction histidine kinase